MKEVADLLSSGRQHLLNGDNDQASLIFCEAGRELLKIADKQSGQDRATTFVHAATAFMEGGDSNKAINVLNSADITTLNDRWRNLHKQRMGVALQRIAGRYISNRREEVDKNVSAGNWCKVIELLSDDPYIMQPSLIAEYRQNACRYLGKTEASEEFAKDAERLRKTNR